MRSTSIKMLLALVPILFGCGATECLCRSAADEARQFPRIGEGAELVPGQIYFLEGFMYTGFEDSGLISSGLSSANALEIFEDLKWPAFCDRWSIECSTRIENTEIANGKRIRIASIKALVKFLGLGESGSELSRNQCRPGSLQVESLVSLRPLVYAPLPDAE